MCQFPRTRGWWLSAFLLTALFALFAAAPAAFADNPITLHHVTFSGSVHDVVPGAIAVDTTAGSVLAPAPGTTIMMAGKTVKPSQLSPGKQITIVLPDGSAQLAAITNNLAVIELSNGSVAVPTSQINANNVTGTIDVGHPVPMQQAIALAAQGTAVPSQLTIPVPGMPSGTTYGVVLGEINKQFLLETAESGSVVLRTIPEAQGLELQGMIGKAVVLMPQNNKLAAKAWRAGQNGRIAFPATVQSVSNNGVYLKTANGTVIVPRQGAEFLPYRAPARTAAAAPATSSAVAGYYSAPQTATYPLASDLGPDAAYYGSDYEDYNPAYSPDEPPYALSAMPPPPDPYPAYGPDYDYTSYDQYPDYQPGYVDPGVALEAGQPVDVVLPTDELAFDGLSGTTALMTGPYGAYSLPVQALPPYYASQPVMFPYQDQVYGMPLSTAISLQLGDNFSLTFGNPYTPYYGDGMYLGPTGPPALMGYGPDVYGYPAGYNPWYPPTIVPIGALPDPIATAQAQVMLPNGTVLSMAFGNALNEMQYHHAYLYGQPTFPVPVNNVMVGMVQPDGTLASVPLDTALVVQQAQPVGFVQPSSWGSNYNNVMVDMRMRDGRVQRMPLAQGLAMERQGAVLASDPQLPAALANQPVPVRTFNGDVMRMPLSHALAMQRARANYLPAAGQMLASTTSRTARVNVRMPNGTTQQLPAAQAFRLQRRGTAQIDPRTPAALGNPTPVGRLASLQRGVVLGHNGNNVLLQTMNHGRAQLHSVPASQLNTAARLRTGQAVALHAAGANRIQAVPLTSRVAGQHVTAPRQAFNAGARGFQRGATLAPNGVQRVPGVATPRGQALRNAAAIGAGATLGAAATRMRAMNPQQQRAMLHQMPAAQQRAVMQQLRATQRTALHSTAPATLRAPFQAGNPAAQRAAALHATAAQRAAALHANPAQRAAALHANPAAQRAAALHANPAAQRAALHANPATQRATLHAGTPQQRAAALRGMSPQQQRAALH
jgi:hypothetical protein